jgi:hypothetical protein
MIRELQRDGHSCLVMTADLRSGEVPAPSDDRGLDVARFKLVENDAADQRWGRHRIRPSCASSPRTASATSLGSAPSWACSAQGSAATPVSGIPGRDRHSLRMRGGGLQVGERRKAPREQIFADDVEQRRTAGERQRSLDALARMNSAAR